jgi:hypothetical protein
VVLITTTDWTRSLELNTWAQDAISDALRLVLQIRHVEIVCDLARSSSRAHEGSMANQTSGYPIYEDVALRMHVR